MLLYVFYSIESQEFRKAGTVFFNASVVLAGLKNPSGGSGKLLEWVRKRRIAEIINEIILQESVRYAD